MGTIIENLEIIDAGSEGNAVARHEDMVIFVPYGVPGDILDAEVISRKKSFAEARIISLKQPSKFRAEPFCSHFGTCGGCRWQQMTYLGQMKYKQKQVEDALTRIGKIESPRVRPIIGSFKTSGYRNKLEFTFSSRRWFTGHDEPPSPALGFHVPGRWDKVLDIQTCHLMDEPSNLIRQEAKKYAIEKGLEFYDPKLHKGFLRNMILRTTTSGEVMLIMVFARSDREEIEAMMDHLLAKFPSVTSAFFTVNTKQNDSITDQVQEHYRGTRYLTQELPSLRKDMPAVKFRIGPVSFFQTNPVQAGNLFRTIAEYLDPQGDEIVYDLYTGTGSIANYIAPLVKRVIGIESVKPAVEDARVNAEINGNANTVFVAGETEKLLTGEFLEQHGAPDVVITDPPRSGMHEKVIKTLCGLGPLRIIYVSCNPATQARDLAMLSGHYRFIESRPVDMFPQTQHVENVSLLFRV
jgi:23S rRNA (uracil1939-C5)-methyltransferase